MKTVVCAAILLLSLISNLYADNILTAYSIKYEYQIKRDDKVIKSGTVVARNGEPARVSELKSIKYISDCLSKLYRTENIGFTAEFSPELVTTSRIHSALKLNFTELIQSKVGNLCNQETIKSTNVDNITLMSTNELPTSESLSSDYAITVKQELVD